MSYEEIQGSPFRVHEIDELYNNVKSFRSTAFSRDLLNFIAKFPFVAPYNAMLIFMQKPGSKYVATAKVWQERFGRIPKPEARPLVILKQFGPVSFVFEISDTEGKDVPEEIINPFKVSGSLQGKIFFYLREGLTKEAIEYKEQNYGTQKAAHIQRLDNSKIIPSGKIKKGVPIYLISNFVMVVNENLGELEKVATIFHELGHYFCGHFPMPENIKHIPKRCNLNPLVKEFEAETVCWLLCERLGIKNPSEEYLSGYLENNEEIPEGISYDAILKSCGKIEQMLNGKYTTPKVLIYK